MKTKSEHAVVIVAGGKGLRVGADIPKQFLPLAKKPMLMRTIEKFYAFDSAIHIVVVLHPDYFNLWAELCKEYSFNVVCKLVVGGATRFDSVKRGLAAVSKSAIVGIHDAARPFVTKELIRQCYYKSEREQCGVIPVVDEKNSLRMVNGDSHQPLDRSRVKIVQTPQMFPAHLIKEAYEVEFNPLFTDDATVAESNNVIVKLIEGEDANIKVTTTDDIDYASYLLSLD
jgi:2-C-methyl-D-erythritol 4-phosphate cytidylyltransferase